MPTIITRAEWGHSGFAKPLYAVAPGVRSAFFTHYHGGPTGGRTGVEVPRLIDRIHKGNGWSGIGYNFVVDQAGAIYEGRGWMYAGAHCPNWNTRGISAQGHIGGDERPSEAMRASLRWLYDVACRRIGGQALRRMVHLDAYPTSCPGRPLLAWVRGGMPADSPGLPLSTVRFPGALVEDGQWGPLTAAMLLRVLRMPGATGNTDYWLKVQAALGVGEINRTGRPNPATISAIERWAGKLAVDGVMDLSGAANPDVARVQKVINDQLELLIAEEKAGATDVS